MKQPQNNPFLKSTLLGLVILGFTFQGCEALEKAFGDFARGNQLGVATDGATTTENFGVQPLPNNYEKAELDLVEPGTETDLAPFSAVGQLATSGCRAPLTVPMSPQFAEAGDLHGNITIVGNGDSCGQNINYQAPNVAIEFSAIYPTTARAPWRIVSLNPGSQIVVTNGQVTISFRYTRSPQQVNVTEIRFVS